MDLFPTVLEATDVQIPGDIQGRSFLPLLQGRDWDPRDVIFAGKNTVDGDAKRCVRSERFKYIRNYDPGPELVIPDSEISVTRRDMGNDHVRPRPEAEFYDLDADPAEQVNLAGQARFADVETELAERLHAIQQETTDPILAGPISRPPDETERLDRAYDTIIDDCPFPRNGLTCAYYEQRRRDWTFAEPRVRYYR